MDHAVLTKNLMKKQIMYIQILKKLLKKSILKLLPMSIEKRLSSL